MANERGVVSATNLDSYNTGEKLNALYNE